MPPLNSVVILSQYLFKLYLYLIWILTKLLLIVILTSEYNYLAFNNNLKIFFFVFYYFTIVNYRYIVYQSNEVPLNVNKIILPYFCTKK